MVTSARPATWKPLPATDWAIDANPSVSAGLQSGFSSRQLFEHNLTSLVNVLEYCKAHRAGLVLLSSSRVYSIPALTLLPLICPADFSELVFVIRPSSWGACPAYFNTDASIATYNSSFAWPEKPSVTCGIALYSGPE